MIMKTVKSIGLILTITVIHLSLYSCKNESELPRIVMIVSNQDTYGNTNIRTANHFEEIVVAYDVFINKGFAVDFVSPDGGAVPIGYLNTTDPIQKQYIYDHTLMDLLKTTKTPSEIDPENYKAIYYSGGGAAMFGVPENKTIQNIAKTIHTNNGVVSAVCHGSAGIVHVKDQNGNPIYYGKKVNGFPNKFENSKADYFKTFSFTIEDALKDNGGNYSFSEDGWDGYFVEDGNLITGQDPTSTQAVAQAVVDYIFRNN
ncbi:MAG: type 1 glutamine amidotransferase domain-containing protein [Bacteroidota bacterium]